MRKWALGKAHAPRRTRYCRPMNPMVESLREVPLFRDLSNRDLKRLAGSMSEMKFGSGETVVSQGKGGVGFFVILDGRAKVSQDGEDRGTLGPGDFFGEMALIDGDDRAASVVADGDLHCAAMTMWNFKPFVKEHPDVAWALLTALVKRVRETHARHTVSAA
jgi:CRP/FNR family cyclic AMP-dependent transcriptional regulator